MYKMHVNKARCNEKESSISPAGWQVSRMTCSQMPPARGRSDTGWAVGHGTLFLTPVMEMSIVNSLAKSKSIVEFAKGIVSLSRRSTLSQPEKVERLKLKEN